MSSNPGEARSRRSVIAAAVAAGAVLVADAMVQPSTARAAAGDPFLLAANNDAGTDPTNFLSTATFPTLTVENSGDGAALVAQTQKGTAFIARSSASGYASVYGYHEAGYGVIGDTGYLAATDGMAGVWGRDASVTGAVGVGGGSVNGTGLVGVGSASSAVAQPPAALGPNALPEPTGVYGVSPSGVGVRAQSDTGTALKVSGKTHFSRSGRATVGAGKSFVDVVVAGGVAATSLCFANLTAYRAGVYVAAVRPAYPTTAKIRIYLNKAVVKATVVAWLVSD